MNPSTQPGRRSDNLGCTQINVYLEFIESEQLLEEYPDANERPVVINIYMQFGPPEVAVVFFSHVRNALAERSIEFCWKVVMGQ